jgi:hypothetical protein
MNVALGFESYKTLDLGYLLNALFYPAYLFHHPSHPFNVYNRCSYEV